MKPGTRVRCRYRDAHKGTLLAVDDPRAWAGTGAFGPGLPSRAAVRAHVAWCRANVRSDFGAATDSQPVAWDFGAVYWDRDLTAVRP